MRTSLLIALLGLCLISWAQNPASIHPQFPGNNPIIQELQNGTTQSGVISEQGISSVETKFPGQNVMSMIASPQIIEESKSINSPADNFAPQQIITVPQGWSGISGFIIPDIPGIETLFKPVMDKFVILYNQSGMYYPDQNINTLVNWDPQAGYIAKFNQSASLGFSGQVNNNRTIILNAGWNLIPVLSNCPLNVAEFFQTQDMVVVKDVASYKLYWPTMGINTLNELLPGKAYYVLMNAPGELTFPDCTIPAWQCGQPFVDPRDSRVYNTVQIGAQCWMAQNLNFGNRINGNAPQTNNANFEKYCYNDQEANCYIYGGLYQWNEMMRYIQGSGTQGLCPDGWYIPDESEWNWLTNYLGGNATAGGALKSTASGFWSQPNTGATNSAGFNGLPGGQREVSGLFSNQTYFANFWTSTIPTTTLALRTQLMHNNTQITLTNIEKNLGFSVRCLKKETLSVNSETLTIGQPGGIYSIELTSSTSWAIVEDMPWLSISPNSGSGNAILSILCEENISRETREGTISVSTIGAYNSLTLEVEQMPLLWMCGDPIEDIRDSNVYPTVRVGDQCWLASNLNIGNLLLDSNDQTNNGTIEKYCPGNDIIQCAIYGGLYQWSEMMEYSNGFMVKGICPEGWRLPESGEWDEMVQTLGGEWIAGGKMKTIGTVEEGTGLWYAPNTGASNSSGFSMLPTGYRFGDEIITGTGYAAILWSSDYQSGLPRSYVLSNSTEDIFTWDAETNFGFSVRCIMKDSADSYIKATPAQSNAPAEAGSVIISVNSNTSWQVTETTDWLTIDPATGNGNGQITVTCDANLITEPRSASIWVVSEDRNIEIIINQNEFLPVLTIDPSSLLLPDYPGTINLIIQSNTSWMIEETPEWFSISSMTGNGNDTLLLTHEANIGTDLRIGQFTILGISGNPNIQVTMNQAGFHQCGNTFIDTRDNKIYISIQIDNQCWMTQNLNVGTMIAGSVNQTNNGIIEKYCYNNDEEQCNVYGGLYQWDEMMQYNNPLEMKGICPLGWHLPSDTDWCIVTTFLDSSIDCSALGWSGTNAGGMLKENGTTHWLEPNVGANNNSGFTGLPGGYRSIEGSFFNQASYGLWWSSSQDNSPNSWVRSLCNNFAKVDRGSTSKSYGFSIRCLKDVPQLEVTPSSQSVTSDEGTITFTIKSNSSWTVSENIDWLTVSPMSGFNNETITVTYDENNTNYQRNGLISIVAFGGIPEIIVAVNQVSTMFNCGDKLIDGRDSKSYNTVQIGSQCWMAQNLKIGTMIAGSENQTNNGVIEKYCYNNDEEQCNVYGGLYQWNEMMQYSTTPGISGICPQGWHLPTDNEYTLMTNFISNQPNWTCNGYSSYIAKSVASKSGWYSFSLACSIGNESSSNNLSGFSGQPNGLRSTGSTFISQGSEGFWWKSSQYNSIDARILNLRYYGTEVYGGWDNKSSGLSVRCLKDVPELGVNPASRNVTFQAGTTIFLVTSNTLWTVSESLDWLTVTPVSGENNGTLTVTYDENTTNTQRTGQITVTAYEGTPEIIVSVNQVSTIFNCGDALIDTRDSKSYNTVQIGTQCWMAQNLNIGTQIDGANNQTNNLTIEKYCYNNDEANCDVYGGLFQWNEMMQYSLTPGVQGICPSGWHVPSDIDWTTLTNYVRSQPAYLCDYNTSYIAKALAETTNWNSSTSTCAVGNNLASNNATGFSGIPAGYNASGSFEDKGLCNYFWTSSKSSSTYAWHRDIYYSFANLTRHYYNQSNGFSVRCLKD